MTRTQFTRRNDDGHYVWTVEITVAPIWVADGFDLDDDRDAGAAGARLVRSALCVGIACTDGLVIVDDGYRRIEA